MTLGLRIRRFLAVVVLTAMETTASSQMASPVPPGFAIAGGLRLKELKIGAEAIPNPELIVGAVSLKDSEIVLGMDLIQSRRI